WLYAVVGAGAAFWLVKTQDLAHLYHITSASMEPTCMTGELIFATSVDADEALPGRVVFFRRADKSMACKRWIRADEQTVEVLGSFVFVDGQRLAHRPVSEASGVWTYLESYAGRDYRVQHGARHASQTRFRSTQQSPVLIGDNREYSTDSRHGMEQEGVVAVGHFIAWSSDWSRIGTLL